MTAVKQMKLHPQIGPGQLDFALAASAANGFITEICMWFALGRGDWLPTATWVALLGVLKVPDASARTALHRMAKAGFLKRSKRGSRLGYAISPSWGELFDRWGRVEEDIDASVDGWALVMFNVPEAQRRDRHVLRSLLRSIGFASLGNGVWIASVARLPAAKLSVEASGLGEYVDVFTAEYEGLAKPLELVRRCWDIDAISASYRHFIRDTRRRLKHGPIPAPRVFTDIVLTNSRWRGISATDPGLPPGVLPPTWPRADAKRVRSELFKRFLEPAREYVDALASP